MRVRGLVLGWVLATTVGCPGRLDFDPSTLGTGGNGPASYTGGASGIPQGTGGAYAPVGTGGAGPVITATGGAPAVSGTGGAVVAVGTGGTVAPGTGGAVAAGTGGTVAGATGGKGGSGGTVGTGGAVATGTGGAVGTGGSGPAGGTGGSTVASCPPGFDIFASLFTPKCGGCHGSTAPTKGLDLVTTGLAARVVNKPSTCMNRVFISGTVQNNVATGYLLDKVAGPVTGCGVQMPPSGKLSATEMACVNDWAVQAVAKVTGGTR